MGPTARIACIRKRTQHGLAYYRRLVERSGGIIQIDHGLITLEAASKVSTMEYILVTLPTASLSVSP